MAIDSKVDLVNLIVSRGMYNNVININFATFLWTPTDDNRVEPDPQVSVRLRMDEMCLRNLYQVCGDLIQIIDDARAQTASGQADSLDAAPATTKPN